MRRAGVLDEPGRAAGDRLPVHPLGHLAQQQVAGEPVAREQQGVARRLACDDVAEDRDTGGCVVGAFS
jgi:hypothetical protein